MTAEPEASNTHHEPTPSPTSPDLSNIPLLPPLQPDTERSSFIKLSPSGFHIQHPPKPHHLTTYITPESSLFQTIHMGCAIIDHTAWRLLITGLVDRPFTLDLPTLLTHFPHHTVTAAHECYGPPTKPPTTAYWRVGNVRWTGVRLRDVLELAGVREEGRYVWSEGLDRGEFAGVHADRYQKDLPLEKACGEEVLLAFEVNGERLGEKRGGPVRLAVPGWFGTNSTKWISRIEVADRRAPGPYTTRFYNELDPTPGVAPGTMRPVWQMEPNSMIVRPTPEDKVESQNLEVEGWAWGVDAVRLVEVSSDGGRTWKQATLDERQDFGWQRFSMRLKLDPGRYTVVARATGGDGRVQPLGGRRNHCHSVECEVVSSNWNHGKVSQSTASEN